MDFVNIFNENFVLVVMVACLVIGYIIKHATFLKWVPNGDIPVILAAFGLALNLLVTGISIEAAVYGALMGLASTGFHQAFSRFVEGKAKEEVSEE